MNILAISREKIDRYAKLSHDLYVLEIELEGGIITGREYESALITTMEVYHDDIDAMNKS